MNDSVYDFYDFFFFGILAGEIGFRFNTSINRAKELLTQNDERLKPIREQYRGCPDYHIIELGVQVVENYMREELTCREVGNHEAS